jgi:glycosyltransferase involved in cell wall biosynthesis
VRIAIDARELRGKPTGVGRFLAEILAVWETMPDAQAQEFILLAPDGVAPHAGIVWEQIVLPQLVRKAGADVLFSPAYSGPMLPPVPMVVAIHDVSFAAHPEWFTWREGARRRTTVQLAARAATRVVTISQFSKREIVAHLGIDGSKVVVAYPGVADLKRPRMVDGVPHAAQPLRVRDTSSQTVLFVGSIFNRRHVPELIEGFGRVARAHPDARLEIVGDNRTSPVIDLAGAIRAAGLADRIQFRSYVTDQELHALYAGASAFAFLSEYEGFGLTPLEAMGAGLPVLLLDTPVAREICGDAAIYLERPDPTLIEGALTTLLFDAEARRRLMDAAEHVLARYSWTECAAQVLTVLLASGRGVHR